MEGRNAYCTSNGPDFFFCCSTTAIALASYGDNALPLFATALHLDIEDLAGFATESLTNHPSDKKADIIYINEADGVVCVAQGYTARNWGKQAAPTKKASDLNTAAAWLLRTPINEVPEQIRTQAKLMRDGLQKKTLTKGHFCIHPQRLRVAKCRGRAKNRAPSAQGLGLAQRCGC